MAVGTHKLNTSAARSKRVEPQPIPKDKISITPANSAFHDPSYGAGKTLEDFVSDCDQVRCEFDSGCVVTLRGGSIRHLMKSDAKNSK